MSRKVEQPTGLAKEGRKDNVVKLEIRTPHGSASERRAHGKALRDSVPRESHAGWNPPHHRRDPVDLLIESNQGRLPQLIPIRFSRMMQSPFTFYRGSAGLIAADLATMPVSGLRVERPSTEGAPNDGYLQVRSFNSPRQNGGFRCHWPQKWGSVYTEKNQ